MFQSGNMIIIGTQCCIFITESFNFKTVTLLKLGLNYRADTTWDMLTLRLLAGLASKPNH